jgi:hypothetical protein
MRISKNSSLKNIVFAMKYQQSTSSGDLHQRLSEFQVALRTSERCDPPSLLLSQVCMGSAKVFCPMWRECKEVAGYYGSSNSLFLFMS